MSAAEAVEQETVIPILDRPDNELLNGREKQRLTNSFKKVDAAEKALNAGLEDENIADSDITRLENDRNQVVVAWNSLVNEISGGISETVIGNEDTLDPDADPQDDPPEHPDPGTGVEIRENAENAPESPDKPSLDRLEPVELGDMAAPVPEVPHSQRDLEQRDPRPAPTDVASARRPAVRRTQSNIPASAKNLQVKNQSSQVHETIKNAIRHVDSNTVIDLEGLPDNLMESNEALASSLRQNISNEAQIREVQNQLDILLKERDKWQEARHVLKQAADATAGGAVKVHGMDVEGLIECYASRIGINGRHYGDVMLFVINPQSGQIDSHRLENAQLREHPPGIFTIVESAG